MTPVFSRLKVDRVDHVVAGRVEDHARSVTQRALGSVTARVPLSGSMSRNTPFQRKATSPCINDHGA
jgi:hypothetical protein